MRGNEFVAKVLSVAACTIHVALAETAPEGYLYAVDNAARAQLCPGATKPPADAPYRDASRPIEERIDDLLKYLTDEEKMDLLHAPGGMSLGDNPRIGLAAFRTPDGPNGPRTERPVTYFPAPIAYAATFDRPLMREIGRVHGEETRGVYPSTNSPARMLLGPGVNLARTPLGGRNFEYFGEDPYLSGVCGGEYCLGLQSCKVAPSLKHYVLNDQEWCRTVIDVDCPERALRELYLRSFGLAVSIADCWSVMNSLNGESGRFMSHNLRLNKMLDEYGFTGAILTDWGGMRGTVAGFNGGTTIETSVQRDPARDKEEVAQLKRGELDGGRIEEALRRNLRLFFRVGAFDTETEKDKREQETCERAFGSEAHFAVARRTAEESFVLLENRNAFLPLDCAKVKTVALIGPGADMHYSMIDGTPVHHAGGAAAINPIAEPTPLEVFVKAFGKENVFFSPGMRYANANRCTVDGIVEWPIEVAARKADVVVYCGGTDHTYDKEGAFPGNSGPCDKPDLGLTGPQSALIAQVAKVNPNVVVALTIGAPVSVEPWDQHVKAVLVTWYSGQFGAETLYRTIFGEVNPSGKLPYTFGRKLEDWPAHAMGEISYPGLYTNSVPELFRKQDKLRAYQKYLDGIWVGYRGFDRYGVKPKYPFGFGLSYTAYGIAKDTCDFSKRLFAVKASNDGARAGRCVVQCYVSKWANGVEMPEKELAGFESVFLNPGESKLVSFHVSEESLRYWDVRTHAWKLPEAYAVRIGTSSADLPVEYASDGYRCKEEVQTEFWPVPCDQDRATILWTKPICVEPTCYCAWPTPTVRPDGEIIVSFSGDRLSHACPFGKVQAIRSRDNGETWSAPETWMNSVIDDRDAGVLALDNGDILLHWFSSITFWHLNSKTAPKSIPLRIWEKMDKAMVCDVLGHWTSRSTDGGRTWEKPVRIHGQTPHGPIQLRSGRLLMIGRVMTWPGEYMPGEAAKSEHELPVLVSDDRGRSWSKLTSIVPSKETYSDITAFHEPHVAELPDGTLIAQFRWHGKDEIIPQCESTDGGKTWTMLHPTGISGLPPHLTVLPDGRLLTVYAIRTPRLGKEIGEYGCFSDDGGRTWDVEHEVKFASHFSDDMGYPASCVLPNGEILTVFYQTRGKDVDIGETSGLPQTCIWATKWKAK